MLSIRNSTAIWSDSPALIHLGELLQNNLFTCLYRKCLVIHSNASCRLLPLITLSLVNTAVFKLQMRIVVFARQLTAERVSLSLKTIQPTCKFTECGEPVCLGGILAPNDIKCKCFDGYVGDNCELPDCNRGSGFDPPPITSTDKTFALIIDGSWTGYNGLFLSK